MTYCTSAGSSRALIGRRGLKPRRKVRIVQILLRPRIRRRVRIEPCVVEQQRLGAAIGEVHASSQRRPNTRRFSRRSASRADPKTPRSRTAAPPAAPPAVAGSAAGAAGTGRRFRRRRLARRRECPRSALHVRTAAASDAPRRCEATALRADGVLGRMHDVAVRPVASGPCERRSPATARSRGRFRRRRHARDAHLRDGFFLDARCARANGDQRGERFRAKRRDGERDEQPPVVAIFEEGTKPPAGRLGRDEGRIPPSSVRATPNSGRRRKGRSYRARTPMLRGNREPHSIDPRFSAGRRYCFATSPRCSKIKQGFRRAVDLFVEHFSGRSIDYVVGVEARGYILGAPVAYALGAGFIPIRKPGKLPYETISEEYALEYGTNALEVHSDALSEGDRVRRRRRRARDRRHRGGDAASARASRRARRGHRFSHRTRRARRTHERSRASTSSRSCTFDLPRTVMHVATDS